MTLCVMETRSQRGLTLAELLLAVTLSAVLLGLSVPSFSDAFARTRIRSAGDAVAAGHAQARALALARGEAVDLCLADAASAACRPEATPTASVVAIWPAAGQEPLWRQALPRGTRVVGNRARLRFYPSPRAGTTATWTVCDLRGQAPVHHWIVSQAGRLRDEAGVTTACPPVKP